MTSPWPSIVAPWSDGRRQSRRRTQAGLGPRVRSCFRAVADREIIYDRTPPDCHRRASEDEEARPPKDWPPVRSSSRRSASALSSFIAESSTTSPPPNPHARATVDRTPAQMSALPAGVADLLGASAMSRSDARWSRPLPGTGGNRLGDLYSAFLRTAVTPPFALASGGLFGTGPTASSPSWHR